MFAKAACLALIAALAVPVGAQAAPKAQASQTQISSFLDQLRKRPKVQEDLHATLAPLGKRRPQAEQLIYNWDSEKAFKQALCSQYPRICKAVRRCIEAGVPTYVASKASGNSTGKAVAQGAFVCAVAAIFSYVGGP